MAISSVASGYDGVSLLAGNVAYIPAYRGVFAGGNDGVVGPQNVIDYVNISSTGNAIDFGDLTGARSGIAGCSSSTRGLFGGGDAGGDDLRGYPWLFGHHQKQ